MKKNDPDGEEKIKFDFPSRELGFYGVPFKVSCLLSLFGVLIQILFAVQRFVATNCAGLFGSFGRRSPVFCLGTRRCGSCVV